MLRIFFTGAFRKPRELNWVIGFVLFILAMAEGFTGYSLPDDLLSGNGLRIIDGMVKGIPVDRHLDLVPALRRRVPRHRDRRPPLHAAHPAAAGDRRRAHRAAPASSSSCTSTRSTPAPGKHAAERRRLPDPADLRGEGRWVLLHRLRRRSRSSRRCSRSTRSGTTARTTPPRCPPVPSPTGTSASPTAPCVSIPPGWEFVLARPHLVVQHPRPAHRDRHLHRRSSLIYPFIEAWVTGDKREHHIADRPRNAPTRTAIGAAGVTFYAGLWAAASSDIIATHFTLTMEGVIHALQAVVDPRPVHRVLHHEARLHRAAEEGPRDRAARLRVGSHREAARWRVHRGARAPRRVRALAAGELRRLQAAR